MLLVQDFKYKKTGFMMACLFFVHRGLPISASAKNLSISSYSKIFPILAQTFSWQ